MKKFNGPLSLTKKEGDLLFLAKNISAFWNWHVDANEVYSLESEKLWLIIKSTNSKIT